MLLVHSGAHRIFATQMTCSEDVGGVGEQGAQSRRKHGNSGESVGSERYRTAREIGAARDDWQMSERFHSSAEVGELLPRGPGGAKESADP